MENKIPKPNFKELYLPIRGDGGLVKFRATKDGFVIPLSFSKERKNQHLTIYFKHFKETKEENPEELMYLNLHIKDETSNKKVFEEDFYFNLTKIQNIIKHNFQKFLEVLGKNLIPEDELKDKLFSVDAYLDEIKFQENFDLLKKKHTANEFLKKIDNREIKDVEEVKQFPYTDFKEGKDYYCFESDCLYRKMNIEGSIFFFNMSNAEDLQRDLFGLLASLFPKFKEKFRDFSNIIDVHFPDLIDMENINKILNK